MKKRSEVAKSKTEDAGVTGAEAALDILDADDETRESVMKDVKSEAKKDAPKPPESAPAPEARKVIEFRTANPAKTHALRPDMQRIVEKTWINDMHETATRLRTALSVGEKMSDHGTLMKALDVAETNAHDAHRLYLTAKLEYERWELDNQVVFGAMIGDATRALQYDKEHGGRSKQITDADVQAKVSVLYPDEWRHQESKRRSVKLTVDSLSNLSDIWMSRCRTLQAMLAKLRG